MSHNIYIWVALSPAGVDMSRPEHRGPPEFFYGLDEARKYSYNSRIQQVQLEMAQRALELLALPDDGEGGRRLILDMGCGSGLSGDVVKEAGHDWIGMDISGPMLQIAREEDSSLALLHSDMGQGVPLRPGSVDGCISISALQWLCHSNRSWENPYKRLSRLFVTLFGALCRGARAVFQFYPESPDQIDMILNAATKAGFTGGLVVDYPNSTKAKKYYLCLLTAGVVSLPAAKGVAAAADDSAVGSFKRARVQKHQKEHESKRDYILRKKELYKKRGRAVVDDSKYTGRTRADGGGGEEEEETLCLDCKGDTLGGEDKDRADRFARALSAPLVDIAGLKQLAWHGVPTLFRSEVWKVLLGYVPLTARRRHEFLASKRAEYEGLVDRYLGERTRRDDDTYHQISIDVPRTFPEEPLFRQPVVRDALTRVLYCWAIRRPATGYVQGMNDLATPLFDVFLKEHCHSDGRIRLTRDDLLQVEADVFWCFGRLLDKLQDNFTFNQARLYRQIAALKEIVHRADVPLVQHLDRIGAEFTQFSFRWFNCLLLREFPLQAAERIWDTCLSEGENGLHEFHVYVCAAFLCRCSVAVQGMDFQEASLYLQNPPTRHWTGRDIASLLSEAYILKTIFSDTIARLL